MTINVRICTPKGIIWEGFAQSVTLPGSDGEMGILSGHIPLITSLKIGIIRIRVNWQLLTLFIREGFAQIEGDEVTVLVQAAEWSDQIDLQLAQDELAAAEVSVKRSSTNRAKVLASKAVKVAQTRLKAAQEFSLVGQS